MTGVQTCALPIYGLSRYCSAHKQRAIRHGSPNGSPLVQNRGNKSYKRESDFVHELFIKNIDSLPVQSGMKILRQWIASAKGGLDVSGARLLNRIDDIDSVLLPILTDLSSLYIYAVNSRNASDTEITYGLSNALYRHIPRTYKTHYSSSGNAYQRPDIQIGSYERKSIGEYVQIGRAACRERG